MNLNAAHRGGEHVHSYCCCQTDSCVNLADEPVSCGHVTAV